MYKIENLMPNQAFSENQACQKSRLHGEIYTLFKKKLSEIKAKYAKEKPLTVFISYAWARPDALPDSLEKAHESYVQAIAIDLELAGFKIYLDRWYDRKGKEITAFLEYLENADVIIPVSTRLYLEKYKKRNESENDPDHVVRAEGKVLNALAIHNDQLKEKIKPILLEGKLAEGLPFLLRSGIPVDLVNRDYFDEIFALIRDCYLIDQRDSDFLKLQNEFKNGIKQLEQGLPASNALSTVGFFPDRRVSLIAENYMMQHPLQDFNKFIRENHPSHFDLTNNCAAFSEIDLSNKKLAYAAFSRVNFEKAKFLKTDLKCATLSDSNLQHADLEEADLTDADLSRASLEGANITSTIGLTYQHLLAADYQQVKLDRGRDNQRHIDRLTRVDLARKKAREEKKAKELRDEIERFSQQLTQEELESCLSENTSDEFSTEVIEACDRFNTYLSTEKDKSIAGIIQELSAEEFEDFVACYKTVKANKTFLFKRNSMAFKI